MDNFVVDQQSRTDINGSTNFPILIDVMKGKNGIGINFCLKSGPDYFRWYHRFQNDKANVRNS